MEKDMVVPSRPKRGAAEHCIHGSIRGITAANDMSLP